MSGGLHVSNLCVGYGRRQVVRDLTLSPIPRGGLTALVGPNAAGKSTLLRAMAGLLPARGSLRLDGEDLTALSREARARRVGFMPQALPQGVGLTVMETVLSALRATPLDTAPGGRAAEREAAAILSRIGIAPLAMERLDRLSGGQRQLVSLAQALVRRPSTLLLDEPTSALDLRHQAVVMGLARELATEGRVVVVVLHDLALAARYADRVVVLSAGRLAAEGPPEVAITPAVLAEVYGVAARVETCSAGRLQVMVDGPLNDRSEAMR